MNKWIFRIAATIVFLDVWLLSAAGLIYFSKEFNIEINAVLVLIFEILSVFSLIYFEKHSNDYEKLTKTTHLSQGPAGLQFSPVTQKLIAESQAERIKEDLKLYLSVYDKDPKDFTEEDIKKFKEFRDMLEDVR